MTLWESWRRITLACSSQMWDLSVGFGSTIDDKSDISSRQSLLMSYYSKSSTIQTHLSSSSKLHCKLLTSDTQQHTFVQIFIILTHRLEEDQVGNVVYEFINPYMRPSTLSSIIAHVQLFSTEMIYFISL